MFVRACGVQTRAIWFSQYMPLLEEFGPLQLLEEEVPASDEDKVNT